MRTFFQKLKRDCRGAVTVFVTLLLIPAILVSGSGVDIARLYVARSEVQDANQLASNSALASYDALLQDLYGLYGIMQTDEELANMMDAYIRLALFGEDWKDRSLGTFSHFYADRSSLSRQRPHRTKIWKIRRCCGGRSRNTSSSVLPGSLFRRFWISWILSKRSRRTPPLSRIR